MEELIVVEGGGRRCRCVSTLTTIQNYKISRTKKNEFASGVFAKKPQISLLWSTAEKARVSYNTTSGIVPTYSFYSLTVYQDLRLTPGGLQAQLFKIEQQHERVSVGPSSWNHPRLWRCKGSRSPKWMDLFHWSKSKICPTLHSTFTFPNRLLFIL